MFFSALERILRDSAKCGVFYAETVTATMVGGTTATTIKNAHGNVTETTCGDRSVRNTYNTDQQLTKTVDSDSGETTLTYDDKGNVTGVTAPDHTETFAYDSVDNTLESKTITIDGVTQTYQYGYKLTADKSLDCIIVDGKTVRPNTDVLGRNFNMQLGCILPCYNTATPRRGGENMRDTAERRIKMLLFLCERRQAKVGELANE